MKDKCCILTFDPAKHAIPKWCTGRKWHIPMAVMGRKNRRRAWLTIWKKVKSHATVIDWCTGREWPVNCMTVISAWWQSNMPFQRYWWAIELLYNSVKTGSQVVWRPETLVIRCGRESHHPAEGALGTPEWVWRSDQLVRRCWNENMSQRGWAPRSPVEQPRRTRTTHGYVRRGWGGQYVAVLFGLQLPLTHKLFK